MGRVQHIARLFLAAAAGLMLIACASTSRQQFALADLEPAPQFRFTPIGIPKDAEQAAGMRARLNAGLNLQFLVVGPESELLFPDAVEARWNGQRTPTYLYYVAPGQALVFAIVPDATTAGTLELAAPLLDLNFAARSRFDIPAPSEALATRPGPDVTITESTGAPVPGALLFGQARSDLLAITGEDGKAILDSPERYTPAHHWVMKDGYWSAPFHPLETQRVTLQSAPAELTERPYTLVSEADADGPFATVTVLDEQTGAPIPGALVNIQRTYWLVTDDDGQCTAAIPADAELVEFQAVAPRRAVKSLLAEQGVESVEIRLPAP